MALKTREVSSQKKPPTRKSRTRQARGIMFLEAAVMLPMAAVITFGAAYYANAYVTKTRLGDSARVIARAIQDDPMISQGGFTGGLGDLDRVVLAATGNGDPVPVGFNVATYKSCNPDLSSMSDAQAQEHFARAGRYERRQGAFGNCNERRDVGSRDTVVNIQSYAAQPTDSQIKAQFPYRFVPNPEIGVAAPQADGWHPSGRNTNVPGFGWSYANPNTDKTAPYWISVVAKKASSQWSVFGWTFGLNPEIANYAVVRVVPKSNESVIDSSSGRMSDSTVIYGASAIQWAKTIYVSKPSLATLHCSSAGIWDSGINGCYGITGTAGWWVGVYIDGQLCGQDNSWSVGVTSASFYTSSSCSKALEPGYHTLVCYGANYGDGGTCAYGGANGVTRTLGPDAHQYSYSVLAR